VILDTDKLQSDAAYREDMRHRCYTDHFFLAEMMGFRDFNRRIHQPAVDLYFPKNPNLPIAAQHPIKRRMHLDPRGTFKTTLGRVDSLQWLLALGEDATLLNETATQPLAIAISDATVKYFYRAAAGAAKPLHLLFPELVTEKYPKVPWDTPNRRESGDGDLDRSVAYTSPQSEQSGWHPWVINPDDMVATENSGIKANDEVRKGVISTYYTNINTLRGGGYVNVRGTRYHPFDLYGDILSKIDVEHPEKSGWKLLIRCSLTVKNGQRLVPGEFPAEEDIDLHFPELPQLTYNFLRQQFYDDYETFMCQQQNDPQGGNVPVFDEKLFASCLTAPERIPLIGWQGGQVFTCWRFPYGGKPGMAKYLEGAAAKIVDGKVYVIDCWQGTYTPSGMAERIVAAHALHQADGMMLINTPGSDYMMAHIRNELARKNKSAKINWVYWTDDDHYRQAEMKQLEPLMKVGRVLFSTGMTKQQECHKQFVHFGLVEENGIVECVAKLADMVPISQMRASMEEEEIEHQQRTRENAMLSAFMTQQGMPVLDEKARQQTEAHLSAMTKATNWPALPGGLDG
jgi:hypothetical protein